MHHVPALVARLCFWSLLALATVSSPAWALANVPSSPPSSWIYDGASLLSASERSTLAARKQQLEQQTGARLVVLTLSSADGETPKAIAVRTLNMWNAGRKSALLLVLMSPRELYIQPGTELASLLDGSSSSSICANVVAPKMRSGDRAAALQAGLEAIASRIVSGSAASSAHTDEDILPTAQTRGAAVPLRRYGESDESLSSSGSGSWAWLGWVVGLAGLGGGIWGLTRLLAKKCRECGARMKKSSRTISAATTFSTGEGEHTYTCGGCGYSFSEMYIISQIVESTSTSSSDSSNSSWSSSSYSDSSSWSSSSSDSSSSSSSDSSGGGGSTW